MENNFLLNNLLNKLMLNNIALILFFNIFCVKNLYAQEDRLQATYKENKSLASANIKVKSDNAKQLVENAVKHFMKVRISQACYDFIYNPVWRKGELYVFVFSEKGDVLARGDDSDMLWENISEVKTIKQVPLIQQMLDAKEGKFIGYKWYDAYKASYVKTIIKDGHQYILGVGFFPEGDEYTTKLIVKSAAAFFNAHGKDEAFALISQYNGPFSRGSIYTFALNLDGLFFAHGENPALINQNIADMTDDKGVHFIKELIKVGKEKGKGWINYEWSNDLKRVYVIKVTDKKTKKPYLIGAGYYPHDSLALAEAFVKKSISYLKANGAKVAFPEFSNKVGAFVKGGLSIFVFDLKGKCLANSSEPGLVGQSLINRKDQRGKFYVQEILKVAKKYKQGIVSYYVRNAFTLAYIVEIHIPDGKFIVGCEYSPDSKAKIVESFVNKAVDYFQGHSRFDAFGKFSSRRGGFVQGEDISIFVYSTEGVRYVNGYKKSQIWRNFSKSTDQNGKPVVQDIIALALNGGGWYQYRALNADRRVFVKAAEKSDKTYIIGSGFFV